MKNLFDLLGEAILRLDAALQELASAPEQEQKLKQAEAAIIARGDVTDDAVRSLSDTRARLALFSGRLSNLNRAVADASAAVRLVLQQMAETAAAESRTARANCVARIREVLSSLFLPAELIEPELPRLVPLCGLVRAKEREADRLRNLAGITSSEQVLTAARAIFMSRPPSVSAVQDLKE